MVALIESDKSKAGMLGRVLALLAKPTKPLPCPVPIVGPRLPEMPSVDGLDTLAILILGRKDGALSGPAYWLGDLGAHVQWLYPAIANLNGLARGGFRTPTHVVIDLDSLGGIVPAFDALRRLRNTRPEVPVILVSGDLAVDDFSLERLPLCDASLRAPVTFSALEYALTEAREVNNPAWVSRLKDLSSGL